MRYEYIFPIILMVINVCASIPYAWVGNWRMFVYWIAAATLTYCVTFTGE